MGNILDVPKPIPGTNLFAGVWYTISMTKFPEGFVTWTESKNDEGSPFVQIDINPNQIPHYKPGQKWFKEAQWRFLETNDPSWYLLQNRSLSTGFATCSSNKIGSGYHIVASARHEDFTSLRDGRTWRNHALWKPVPCGGNNYALKLRNYSFGTVTWTYTKYGNHSHYIQIDTRTDQKNHYAKTGNWFDDSQFKFKLADVTNVQLMASISEFNFMEMPSSVLKSHKKSDSQSAILKLTLLNPSSASYTQEIEESFSKTNTVSYRFEQSLKTFMKVTASFSVPLIASGSVEAGFEATVGTNQQVTRSTTKTYTVKQTVNVPPNSSVEVSAFSEWIQDLEIPFDAVMIIRGTMTGTTMTLSGDFLQEYLTAQGETYQVIKSAEDHILVNIKGKFKGTFGYRGIVSVENIK